MCLWSAAIQSRPRYSLSWSTDIQLDYCNITQNRSYGSALIQNSKYALDRMRQIIINQLAAGAEICKVVTTARCLADNLAVLRLIDAFPETKVVAFAMGASGQVSRVLCPLVGGYFTYASIGKGQESADGQITVGELKDIYRMLTRES